MRRADNTADLLAAESSLTQRQAELDSLRASAPHLATRFPTRRSTSTSPPNRP
ncbi:hypothetical protein BZL30_5375 [Mycobacterium kansasii]|uniref:DUF4349 domain-containing protein n=1 Tax=Mycobacterium kansasii TaxID=1768 RepID=A0A1V3WYU8_MYCKA|nr:hypothetical protein BZL30_5375 [Mycobacterium kansasii]